MNNTCEKCGSQNIESIKRWYAKPPAKVYQCKDCPFHWLLLVE